MFSQPKLILTFCTLFSILGCSFEQSNLPEPYCNLQELLPYNSFGFFSDYKKPILKKLVDDHKIKNVVELGSLLGKSTCYFASILPLDGKVYAVDHWLGSENHRTPDRADIYPLLPTLFEQFLSNVIHANFQDKIIPVRSYTVDAAQLIDDGVDMVFIDASHEFEDVLNDIEVWYPKVKSKGVLSGDDWYWSNESVKKAVKLFAQKKQLKINRNGNVWWIIKP